MGICCRCPGIGRYNRVDIIYRRNCTKDAADVAATEFNPVGRIASGSVMDARTDDSGCVYLASDLYLKSFCTAAVTRIIPQVSAEI